MMSAPSSDETSDQHFSLRSATVLQLQTFRVICQPQDIEKDFSGASARLKCRWRRKRRLRSTLSSAILPSVPVNGSSALPPAWCSLLLTTKRPRCKKISLLSRSATAPGPHVSCGITSQRLHVQCRRFVLGAWGASISLGICRMSPTRLPPGRPVVPRTMSSEATHARRRFRSDLFSSATPRGWGAPGQRLCTLHEGPAYLECTRPSCSARPGPAGRLRATRPVPFR